MKIGLIGQKGAPAAYGGVERHVEELAAALAARGHEVAVYSRPHYAPLAPPTYRGFRIITLPSVATKHLDAITHAAMASVDALRRGFDVVHYHAVGPALLCGLPRLAGCRTVVTVHALDWQREKWGAVARAALRAGAAATRLANRVIVVSRRLQAAMRRAYGVSSTYIPNGVAPPERAELDTLRRRFGLRERGYVLFLGRLVPEKGAEALIAAFGRLGVSLRLVMAGEAGPGGGYADAVRRRAAGDERIVFTGGLYGRDKAEAFSHAALFVLPSLVEGMPIVLLEALSYGCPCLVSDIPANLDVLTDVEPHGVATFRAGDVNDLTRRLDAMLRGQPAPPPDLADRVVRAYDWAAIAARTEAVYRAR